MKHFRNILVATDVRLDYHPILDEAVEIALRNDASLKIVDVVPPLPWLARLTLEDPQHFGELLRAEKQDKLQELAMPIRDKGVPVSTRVLSGKASVEITREVLRGEHDLLMRVAKAKTSRRVGFFGTTGIELLRKCPCAVWLVCPTTTAKFRHVLACVDTSSDETTAGELNDKVMDIAGGICAKQGADLSILHAWSIDGEQFLKRRMQDADFESLNTRRYRQAQDQMSGFLNQHGISGDDPRVHLVKGFSTTVIPRYAEEKDVDLVVVGAGAHPGAAGWVLGHVAEQILDSLSCSVLAIKPDGFVSPIKLDREMANA